VEARKNLSQDDKEQEARIALLDYYGSLARHWATLLLATAIAFYSVVQVRELIGDWLLTFTLTIMAAGVVYAFVRMFTLGKYCELALDPKVRPRGVGTPLSQMLHGMQGTLRTNPWWLKYLDGLGEFKGFTFYTLIWVCAWFLFAPLWALGFLPVAALQLSFVQDLRRCWGGVPLISVIAGVVLILCFIGLIQVVSHLTTFQDEIKTHGG
jgi:hypothetical protein